jgi:hypothetical protein
MAFTDFGIEATGLIEIYMGDPDLLNSPLMKSA